MPSYTGTVTSSQGTRTLDVTPNDVITFTPTSGTYTVEYPIGTVAISGASTAQSITSTTSATQMRVTCLTGSVAYSNADGLDNTSVLTPSAAAYWQTAFDAGAIAARTYTWAALPLPSAYTGAAYVSDVGLSGSLWYSNGVTWGLVSGDAVLARGNTDLSVSGGSTSEEALVSITIPAGLIGVNGQLEVTHFWEATNNANVKTMRVKLGGTAFFANAAGLNSNTIFLPPPTRIWNRNSQSVQMAFAAANGNTSVATGTAKTAGAVDTSVATTFAISGQKATGSDTLTLLGYVVRLIRP